MLQHNKPHIYFIAEGFLCAQVQRFAHKPLNNKQPFRCVQGRKSHHLYIFVGFEGIRQRGRFHKLSVAASLKLLFKKRGPNDSQTRPSTYFYLMFLLKTTFCFFSPLTFPSDSRRIQVIYKINLVSNLF